MPASSPQNAEESHRIARIAAEEEALLRRVLDARASAEARDRRRRRDGDSRSVESLRALRDEAASTADDDLPSVLLELSVRQRLVERASELVLPDAGTPYLAHLRVREGAKTKDYLLGTVSFVDAATDVRVVDLRAAAIAAVFYRHRVGDEYEVELPGRIAEGVVLARRVLTIEHGVLKRIQDGDEALVRGEDGAFRPATSARMASGGEGSAIRSFGLGVGVSGASRDVPVTALLDAEQYAAITTPPREPLLVLGSAGSGKTTVALHRLAHLATSTDDRDAIPIARTRVIVPEEGLARLCRRLLKPLGAADANVQTLDRFAEETFRSVFRVPMPKLDRDPPASVTSLKRHPAFFRALLDRFGHPKPDEPPTYRELQRFLVDATSDRAFLTAIVDAAAGSLPRHAIDETIEHTRLQMADPIALQLAAITDPTMKESIDGRPIEEGTPEALAGTLDVDDLPILLTLRARVAAFDLPHIAHLVLDEAEDVSPFELSVLRALLDRRACITLAGDEAQRTSPCFESWDATLAWLGAKNAVTRRLAISYRCPRPIAELARSVLLDAPSEPVQAAREGAEVGFHRFAATHQADLFVFDALRDLVESEPKASVAIIATDAESAAHYEPLLAELPQARLVHQGEFDFDPGIDITHVDDIKGLEFDYVIIPDAHRIAYPDTPQARHRLHVAMTRASHQLWLIAVGTPTPLLPNPTRP